MVVGEDGDEVMKGPEERAALAQLHRRFVELVNKEIYCRRTLIDDVLLHPLSREKLRTAAWTAIRRASRPAVLRNDVIQDATLIVLRSFRYRAPAYVDRGPEKFARWLWLLWYRACRRAVLRMDSTPCRSLEELVSLGGEPALRRLRPNPDPSVRADWNQVMLYITRIDDPELSLVLFDWSMGLTQIESGRLRGVSTSTISRLRKQGMRYLRRKLKIEEN